MTGLRAQKGLNVEQEVHHIAIFYDVVFTFSAHFPGFFGTLFAFVGNKVFIGDGLRADKALFEIGVDFTCGLRSRCADRDSPRANFLHACGEVVCRFSSS